MISRIAILGAAVALDAVIAVLATLDSVNALLNVLTILVALAVAFPVIRSKRKDAVIHEQKQVIESHKNRLDALDADLIGACERADEAEEWAHKSETNAEHWRARYQEQEKYTAPEALELVAKKLGAIEELLRMWIVKDETRDLPPTP